MRLSIFFIFVVTSLFAQKHDYNWINSHTGTIDGSPTYLRPLGGSILNFEEGQPNFELTKSLFYISTSGGGMSDSLGNFIFYTNTQKIVNKENEIMPNSEGLNPGTLNQSFLGNNSTQAIFSLPKPGSSDEYFLFYQNVDVHNTLGVTRYSVKYATVDMRLDMGKGAVTEKNILAIGGNNELLGTFSAVRHGNGRDWWIITPHHTENIIYRFMVTPEGIEHKNQQINLSFQPQDSVFAIKNIWMGQAKFSPDGSIYAFRDVVNGLLYIFGFDRCTGELTLKEKINTDGGRDIIFGLEFSPNNQLIYYCNNLSLMQIDLAANNIASSIDTVAVFDDYQSYFDNTFFIMQLTPTGKIIIAPGNGTLNFHVINAPNEKGKDCEVILHGIQLPTSNTIHLPYYPNYRLYDLHDSPCDTLGIDR